MRPHEKQNRLLELYTRFARDAQPYLASAVCAAGCADCCTTVGNVDTTTLEALFILKHLQSFSPSIQTELNKRLKQNRKIKRESTYAACAFLSDKRTCVIYSVRPFSCRRLYSARRCGETGPAVHRPAWECAQRIAVAIQQLDDTGYLGHMSYMLHLLNDLRFRKTYLSGGFAPLDIREFAQDHKISINRFAGPAVK